jgi:4-alpha-glucanotransferase
MSNEQLETLAAEAGLSIDWVDANGRPQRVAEAVLRKVLDGLGYPADNQSDIEASLKRIQDARHKPTPPPLLTIDHGNHLDLSAWFAPDTSFVLLLEDGTSLDGRLTADAHLPSLAPVGYQQLSIAGQHLTVAVAPSTC